MVSVEESSWNSYRFPYWKIKKNQDEKKSVFRVNVHWKLILSFRIHIIVNVSMSNKSEASRTLRVFPQVLGERREKFRMKSEVHCYRIPVKLFPLSILSLKWRSSTLFDQVYCRFHHGQKVWQLNILEIKKRNGSDKRWKRCVLLWIYWRRPWVISLFWQYYWKASILVSVCRCQWDHSHRPLSLST